MSYAEFCARTVTDELDKDGNANGLIYRKFAWSQWKW